MSKSTYGTGCFMLVNTGERFVASGNRLLTTVAYRLGGQHDLRARGQHLRRRRGRAVAARRAARDPAAPPRARRWRATSPRPRASISCPAFTGLGAPHWDPDARGAILGLTRDSGVAHIVRAALEAVAYQTADLVDAMVADMQDGATDEAGLGTLRVDGGMVVNDWLCQFLADMLDRPVERPAVVETTALGAAYLAGLAAGVYGSLDAVAAGLAAGAAVRAGHGRPTSGRRLLDGWRRAVARVRELSHFRLAMAAAAGMFASEQGPSREAGRLAGNEQRRAQIVDLVRRQGFVSIEALAQRFAVTPQTVRRDINALCDAGGAAAPSRRCRPGLLGREHRLSRPAGPVHRGEAADRAAGRGAHPRPRLAVHQHRHHDRGGRAAPAAACRPAGDHQQPQRRRAC